MIIKHRRTRFQQGSLTIEPRKNGPDVWVYRWREGTTRRKRMIGTKTKFPTQTAALKAVNGLQLDINSGSSTPTQLTVSQLIDHYKLTELAESKPKTALTVKVYKHHLDNVIAPKWGKHPLQTVKPIAVEKWLGELTVAPATKAKTKGVFGVLYQHAMRNEWATTNPIRLVRQSAKSLREYDVLEPGEIAAFLAELAEPFRTLVLLASVTGLRRGELFGLKWQDIRFEDAEIRVVRSLVDQVEGLPKTFTSLRPIPMSDSLASSLRGWKEQSEYADPTDWVFASPLALGKYPYWPDVVLKRQIRPAAERAGITKQIGWHSFRRTLATLLISSGASIKTTQDLLRHSSAVMSIGIYAKGVTADKRSAQDAIAALFVGAQLI